jgi:histone-lysine N-methyltransferase SETD3
MELEDEDLASEMLKHQQRAIDFWQKHWDKAVPLKLNALPVTMRDFSGH